MAMDRPRFITNKAEHVLAFFIFDLAACIQEDSKPPPAA